jgi:hypothetical protein
MKICTGYGLRFPTSASPSTASVTTDRPRHARGRVRHATPSIAGNKAAPGRDDSRDVGRQIWRARIITGDDDNPGTVIDAAQFDTLANAKRWTAAAILHWHAYAPDGWWVTGRITGAGTAKDGGALS